MKILVLAIAALFISPAHAADDSSIQEWLVPWEASVPRDPYVAPDGVVWFNGQRGNYLATLDPETGEFKRYELDDGTHPHNLIIDDQGILWYAGNRSAHIGRLDTASGKIEKIAMPEKGATDPHTLVFNSDGDIWFTLQQSNMVGFLETGTGEVKLFEVATSRARPYGIRMGPDDRPWIVLFGTNKLLTIDPETLDVEEVALPDESARPRRLEITADGRLWYVDYANGRLGEYTPDTGVFRSWPLPAGENSRPYGTALDGQGRIWIAETGIQPNRLVGFDPATEKFFGMIDVPSGGGTLRHMYYDPATDQVWFGADTNYVGRLDVSD